MLKSWLPRILLPDFTWSRPMQANISIETPPCLRIPSKFERRVGGLISSLLFRLSRRYCSWLGIRFNVNIIQLPFGLILKWTGRTSMEEYAAMQMARAAGLPVPKVLWCGEHPNAFANRNFSILMTRLPGLELCNSSDPLNVYQEKTWLSELENCVKAMRQWQSPYADGVCSAIGTSLHSSRIPSHTAGPFQGQQDFYDYLLAPSSPNNFNTEENYRESLVQANRIRTMSQRIKFTHGDLEAHNILVDDKGHLSGILDWECAGWMPEYWDFTTVMRSNGETWWSQVVSWLGGSGYKEELKCDKALARLTSGSYIGLY